MTRIKHTASSAVNMSGSCIAPQNHATANHKSPNKIASLDTIDLEAGKSPPTRLSRSASGKSAASSDTFFLNANKRAAFNKNLADYVGKMIVLPKSSPDASPFYVRALSEYTALEQDLIACINRLSNDTLFREDFFGSNTWNQQQTSAINPSLQLPDEPDYGDDFVEVGAYVVTLDTGEPIVRFVTSNVRNGIDSQYVLVDLLKEEELQEELAARAVRQDSLPASAVSIISTMDGEPYLFEGNLGDWSA